MNLPIDILESIIRFYDKDKEKQYKIFLHFLKLCKYFYNMLISSNLLVRLVSSSKPTWFNVYYRSLGLFSTPMHEYKEYTHLHYKHLIHRAIRDVDKFSNAPFHAYGPINVEYKLWISNECCKYVRSEKQYGTHNDVYCAKSATFVNDAQYISVPLFVCYVYAVCPYLYRKKTMYFYYTIIPFEGKMRFVYIPRYKNGKLVHMHHSKPLCNSIYCNKIIGLGDLDTYISLKSVSYASNNMYDFVRKVPQTTIFDYTFNKKRKSSCIKDNVYYKKIKTS